MITKRGAELYGYVTIALMLIILLLVWFKVVEQSLFVPLLLFACVLFLSRITVRILAARKSKQEASDSSPQE